MFSLKQKTSQILPATVDKIKFYLFKKTVFDSFRQEIIMGKMQNKSHSGRCRHVHGYSSIFRHIQELFRHIQNPV